MGATVAVEPLLACGRCPHCRSGDDNRCRQRTLLGVAVGLLGRHLEQVGSIVTHRFALDQVQTAFAVAADRTAGSVKVLVLP